VLTGTAGRKKKTAKSKHGGDHKVLTFGRTTAWEVAKMKNGRQSPGQRGVHSLGEKEKTTRSWGLGGSVPPCKKK